MQYTDPFVRKDQVIVLD